MLILDSNVWIYVATAEEFPVEIYSDHLGSRIRLFEDFYSATRKTAVSTYILKEIREGFDRSQRVSAREKDETLTDLFKLIRQCDGIEETITRAKLERLSLREERRKTHNRMLGEIFDIQSKDVPIVSLAYEYRSERPHILTDDGEFAALSPAEFGLPAITIEDAGLSW